MATVAPSFLSAGPCCTSRQGSSRHRASSSSSSSQASLHRSRSLASSAAPRPAATYSYQQPPRGPASTDGRALRVRVSAMASEKPRDVAVNFKEEEGSSSSSGSGSSASSAGSSSTDNGLYPEAVRHSISEAWESLIRWSRAKQRGHDSDSVLASTKKVVVFGGGSFGTALASTLARRSETLDVVLLIRDERVCEDINTKHTNQKYLKEYMLPKNVRATTNAEEAIAGSQFALHAVPCQHSRGFLAKIKHLIPPALPIMCVSKGLELGTGDTMAAIIPSVLGPAQPTCFLSGPSFAKEVMEQAPTGLVAASKFPKLAEKVQDLLAGGFLRINTSDDVVGVEICGALKNVLAIAAGIVDGMGLGRNAQAAVVVQGCAEIRWLAERMGASPRTVSGLSGLGDIMLTCYGDLSRNRTVGLRLGAGESLEDITASSTQVAEGVATAGVVVTLARKYRVQLPVLTAVAQMLANELSPKEAVEEIMSLPQVAEH